MRIATIGARMAHHLNHATLKAAGLQHAYYPAPDTINATGVVALIFSGLGATPPSIQEQIWHHEVRVQLMVRGATGFLAKEFNLIETLIEPVWDHFTPGSEASRLALPTSGQMAEHCYPLRYEASQQIEYAGHVYTATTITFDVKTHRFAGDA